jgi:parvulin-like peptidyl-prolyl isomerase
MRRLRHCALALCLLGLGGMVFSEVIDRIVAVVNSNPVLQSDVESELRFRDLAAGRPASPSFSDEQKRAALERLIDRELVRQEMEHSAMPVPTEAQITAQVDEIRKQYPDSQNLAVWKSILAMHGVSEALLRQKIVEQIQTLSVAETRLRPLVQVDAESIQKYYQDEFLPQLRKSGAPDQPLPAVSARIKEILTERKMNEQIAGWLQSLRSQAEIRYIGSAEVPTQ